MSIRLAYGDTRLELNVPPAVELHEYSPQTADRPLRFEEFKDQFIRCDGLSILAAPSLLLVVNDGHRSTPTAFMLDWIDRLDPAVLDRADFLIATGTHSGPTEQHLNKIFGQFLSRVSDRIHVHDARDLDSMERVGSDPLGGDVWIDRTFQQANNVLVISSAEPHYFAGFSGGRKSFFPGLTDFATIERNHNLANSLECAPLKLTGNPMSEHLDKLTELLDLAKVFSIQIVFDAAGKIVRTCLGDLNESFREAAATSSSIYSLDAQEYFDIIVCEILPPLDNSLYQAQKAVENCRAAVKKGGALIVVSDCHEGVGSSHFFELAGQWDAENNRARDGQLKFGSHKLSRINQLSKEITVGIHCKVDDESVRRVFYSPIGDLNTFIVNKVNETGSIRLAVVRDAGNVVLNRPM